MARTSYSVVTISSNSLPCLIALPQCTINVRELLLAIYVQGKNILRKSRIHKNILPWIFLSMKYFLSKSFRTTVICLIGLKIAPVICLLLAIWINAEILIFQILFIYLLTNSKLNLNLNICLNLKYDTDIHSRYYIFNFTAEINNQIFGLFICIGYIWLLWNQSIICFLLKSHT